MKLFFYRGTKGSATVMATLLLIPTIFFTGFLADLTRIKLYSNQAVMTADNYGEAVLTEYDQLLKELYGLFAVSQNEDGIKQLQYLESYMGTSFLPNQNTISWQYMKAITGESSLEGFMPYRNCQVSVSKENVPDANLANSEVIATQIGDFMRFRIVQELGEDGDTVIEAISQVKNTKDDAEAIEKKTELDEKAGEVMEKTKAYYETLDIINKYPNYLQDINSAYEEAITAITDYETQANDEIDDLADDIENREKAVQDILDKYATKMEDEAAIFSETVTVGDITFTTFPDESAQLVDQAGEVKDKMDELQTLRNELQTILDTKNISSTLKTGILDDVKVLDELFGGNTPDFSADNFVALADKIAEGTTQNSEYELNAEDMYLYLCEMAGNFSKGLGASGNVQPNLDKTLWWDFNDTVSYYNLYESLKKCFATSDSEAVENAKNKKSKGEEKLNEAQQELNTVETTTARNIPPQFGYGKEGTAGEFSLLTAIKTAASYFKLSSLSDVSNLLINKFLTVEYDFGMFTSRITNVKDKEDSLTGIPMSEDVNYIYQAELEYVFSGYNSSQENLSSAKNKILAFRAVTNYTSTYSITEIDKIIDSIASAAAAVNPILGYAVSGSLRMAVSAVETAEDWKELKDGNKVVVFKKQLVDLTAYEKINGLLGLPARSGDQNTLKLDYEEYLKVMIMFLTPANIVTERTSNLITLNMNNVVQTIEPGESLAFLEFKMRDAVTAINATCEVQSDFLVMPFGFSEKILNTETNEQIKRMEQNRYSYTVTRGY